MDNRCVKFCLKIVSRFRKIIKKPQAVKFIGTPCRYWQVIEAYQCLIQYYRYQFPTDTFSPGIGGRDPQNYDQTVSAQ